MKQENKPSQCVKRAIVYCRVSTDEQAQRENNSIGTQRAICRNFVEARESQGWKLMEVIEDPGYSAGSLKRPGMQHLIELIEAKLVDVVVIYKLDRLTRSIRDFYDLWAIMEGHGVDFVSATESLDTSTALGRVFLNLILIFGQFERELTAQRLKEKFALYAKEGKRHPGIPPFGYDSDPAQQSLSVNTEEARIVKEIFHLIIETGSPAAVAHILNKKGYRTRTLIRNRGTLDEYTVGGSLWNANKVIKIIQNVAYKAIRLAADGMEYPAKWKPIIARKLWERANKIIRKTDDHESVVKIKTVSLANKAKTLLKGILFCGHCNLAMSPKPGGKKTAEGDLRPYYTCQSVVQFGSHSDCRLRNIAATGFDAFTIRVIAEFGKNPSLIEATVKASEKNKAQSVRPLKSQMQKLKSELKVVSAEVARCLKLARNKNSGSFTNDLLVEANKLSERKQLLELEIEKLRLEIDYCQQSVGNGTLISESLRNLELACQHLDFEERAEVIRLLVERIEIMASGPPKDLAERISSLGKGQPAVQWHKIRIVFHIQQPLEGHLDSAGKTANARTEITLTAGLVGTDWNKGGFVVEPFTLSEALLERASKPVRFIIYKNRHLIATALEWRRLLNDHPHLGTADIAAQVKLSKRRTRQILALANLHPDIRKQILAVPFKRSQRTGTEKHLRSICSLPHSRQLARLRESSPWLFADDHQDSPP